MPDSAKQTSASLRHTPLYERHIAAGARMAPFAGWEMPISYAGINEEHAAVREGCGLFDVSHMGRLSVRGPRSLSFPDELLPREMSKLRSGQMAYAVLCTESGGVVDDLAVSRLREDDYLLVVNASRVVEGTDVILALAAGHPGLRIEDRTLETGMLAVQGPRALEIAQSVLGTSDLYELGYFRCQEFDLAGNTVLISRSGYTGEDGFEMVTERTDAAALWDDMVAAGAVPCGLGARDTLRTEMGYCLYGHELAEDISPIEAGLKWTMDLDKAADFLGKDALRAAAQDGSARRLIGLLLKQRAIPRPGCSIMVSGDKVGQVTSGTFSPTLQKGIALGFVLKRTLEADQTLTVDIRGRLHEAEIVKPPFVRSNVKTRKKV